MRMYQKRTASQTFFVFLSGKGFSLDLLAVFPYAVISIAYFVAL